MAIMTSPSGAFPTALIYITVGSLIDIWTVVAMLYYPPETQWTKFLVVGLMVTGAAFLIIGLLLGQIGRAARHAELPPTEVTPAVEQAEESAAANPPAVVVAGNPPVQTAVSPNRDHVGVPPSPPNVPAATPVPRK
jgi:hypothetical protein